MSIDPIHQFSGLQYGAHHTSLPGQGYLDPYVAFTTDSFSRLVALDWLHFTIPWWNPYVGLGVPLAGQMQPSAFFLPFVLLQALPHGLTWLTISVQIIAGLSTYALARELNIGRLSSLVAGILYELNGTFAWIPGPFAVCCSLAFLPLFLLGIERARRDEKKYSSTIIIALGLSWSIFGGFPETAYLGGLFALSWFLFRFFSEKLNYRYLSTVVTGGIIGLFISAPALISFIDALLESDILKGHFLGKSFLPIKSLPMLFMPTIYGPINAGESATAGINAAWGNVGGYSTISALFLSIFSLFQREDRKFRLFLFFLFIISVIKTFGNNIFSDIINFIPAMSQVAFYRYDAPCWELILIILACLGLDDLLKIESNHRIKFVVAFTSSLILEYICIKISTPDHKWSSLPLHTQRIWLTRSITIATIPVLTITAAYLSNFKILSKYAASFLLISEAFLLFSYPKRVGYIGGELDLSTVSFIKNHVGYGRVMTLGPLAPNYGAYFEIPEINHNMSPVPKLWQKYINNNLLPNYSSVDGGVTFWPVKTGPLSLTSAVMALKINMTNYENMSTKYIISPPYAKDLIEQTFSTNEENEYESPIKLVFQGKVADIWELKHSDPYFQTTKPCQTKIIDRTSIDVFCPEPSDLIRRELFMRGWSAIVNGRFSSIDVTNDVQQKIKLPQGFNHVEFKFIPPYMAYAWIIFFCGLIGFFYQCMSEINLLPRINRITSKYL